MTAAAGRIGKEVIARLKKEHPGVHIRACCRRADKNEFLKFIGADEIIEFDYLNADKFEEVLSGIDILYSCSPDPALKGHENFMQHVAKHKDHIKHIVRISCFGAEQNSGA